MRLDVFLVEHKYAETRSKASQLIKSQKIKVNRKVISKNGFDVSAEDKVEVIKNDVLEFVSRGGHKLAKAIDVFSLDFKDRTICDIGSSTGGFTDCSLKHGAKKVYAIDVGTAQLHTSLRNDPRVIVMENTNFRYMNYSAFKEKIDFFVCDVSFISIRNIIDTLISFNEDFKIILLFKPQFEVGPAKLNKNGVVKKKEYLIDAINDFLLYLKDNELHVLNASYSPILGNKEGNIEFLFYVSNIGKDHLFNVESLVKKVYSVLKEDCKR